MSLWGDELINQFAYDTPEISIICRTDLLIRDSRLHAEYNVYPARFLASLYEQQTTRLLCPCHQSQFLITNNAEPIFGPATRKLPMLPISVDDEGYVVAVSDYTEPVGPGFWERP